MAGHFCLNGEYNENERGWELHDGQGIYLTRVCDTCESEKMNKYNPVILEYYDENDVDEQIEPDE